MQRNEKKLKNKRKRLIFFTKNGILYEAKICNNYVIILKKMKQFCYIFEKSNLLLFAS